MKTMENADDEKRDGLEAKVLENHDEIRMLTIRIRRLEKLLDSLNATKADEAKRLSQSCPPQGG